MRAEQGRADRKDGPRRVPHLLANLRKRCQNAPVTSVIESTSTQVGCQEVSPEADRQRYAAVSRALSDPKRLCVLEVLARGERSVGQLSAEASCQVPNMSQHLAVLRSAGLVVTRREGNTILYRLADPRILEAYRLIQALAR
jgi:DNA-binding transcriptional ArsR family regulator